MESLTTRLLRASFATDQASADLLLVTAHSPQVRERVLALRGLNRRSLMNFDLWREGLFDENVEIRRETLLLLAHAQGLDTELFADVTALLGDEDALVVEAAAFALGEHLTVDAVEELCVVASTHDDARCRESAIAALGAIGDDRARSTILASLDDKPPIRRRAIVALSNFEGPDIEAALLAAGDDKDWQVRAAVTQLKNQED